VRTSVLIIVFISLSGVAPPQEHGAPSGAPPKPESSDARSLTNEQIRELIRHVADKDLENDKKQRDYAFVMRREEHRFDAKRLTKSTESKTYEVMALYDEQVARLIANNDEPLSPNEAAREEQ